MAWPIYVISLERATQRRAACQRALDAMGAPFAFFDAVDGARLSEAEVAAAYDARAMRASTGVRSPCRRSAAISATTCFGSASSTRSSTAP